MKNTIRILALIIATLCFLCIVAACNEKDLPKDPEQTTVENTESQRPGTDITDPSPRPSRPDVTTEQGTPEVTEPEETLTGPFQVEKDTDEFGGLKPAGS